MNIFIAPFYINSPLSVQKTMVLLHGLAFKLLREGRSFKKILSHLEKSQYYSEGELKELQKEKLKSIIRHSYANVPYYRRLFKRLNLTPSDFNDISDLEKLPFISKQVVRKNPEDFLAVNTHKHFIREIFTSGTTGSPLKVYRDLYSINFENAIIRRQYRWAGFYPEDRKVVLRSSPIVPSNVKRPPFWRYDFFQRSMVASAYHLSRENIVSYVREILKYNPAALEVVPSAGYLMAKLINLNKDMRLNFKYIFTTSEALMPHQKAFMQEEFNARIFDHYGTAERVCAIGMCEKGNYHIYPEYGIAELVPLPDNKEYFELVGTTLNNFAMPLLRYKTGDIITKSNQRCSCGRDFQIVESIDGRKTDEFFITSDGRLVSLLSGILSIDLKDVIETQFIQEDLDRIRVRMVTGKRYTDTDESMLRKNIRNYLGDNVKICVEKVPSIPRTASGKFRQFISKVNALYKTKEDFYEEVKCE